MMKKVLDNPGSTSFLFVDPAPSTVSGLAVRLLRFEGTNGTDKLGRGIGGGWQRSWHGDGEREGTR